MQRARRRGPIRGRKRTGIRRMPKSVTSLVPFQVQRNKQIVSPPSHGTGLTVSRQIRITATSGAADTAYGVTFNTILDRLYAELAITLLDSARATFTPSYVRMYGLKEGSYSLKIFDEPRAGTTAGSYNNSPYYDAVDSCIAAGIANISAVVPRAATYSIGSNDQANLLALKFCTVETSTASCPLVIDIGGTFTIKYT